MTNESCQSNSLRFKTHSPAKHQEKEANFELCQEKEFIVLSLIDDGWYPLGSRMTYPEAMRMISARPGEVCCMLEVRDADQPRIENFCELITPTEVRDRTLTDQQKNMGETGPGIESKY